MSEPPRHPAVRAATGPRHARGSRDTTSPDTAMDEASSRRRATVRRTSGRPSTAAMPSAAFGRPGRLQSVLATLPVGMLLIGLVVFYLGEHRQSSATPIAAESVRIEGVFEGLSRVGSGGEGRHFLWLSQDGEAAAATPGSEAETGGQRRRGVRLDAATARALGAALSPGDRIGVDAAPTVAGSTTRWLWRLERDGRALLDEAERLR